MNFPILIFGAFLEERQAMYMFGQPHDSSTYNECPRDGTENKTGKLFCYNCGVPLTVPNIRRYLDFKDIEAIAKWYLWSGNALEAFVVRKFENLPNGLIIGANPVGSYGKGDITVLDERSIKNAFELAERLRSLGIHENVHQYIIHPK